MSTRVYLEDRNAAFSKRVQTFAIVNRNHIDIMEFLMDCFNFFETKVIDMIRNHHIIKVNVCFSAVFEKVIPSTDEQIEKKEKQTIYLNTRSEILDLTSDIDEFFDNSIVNFLISKVDDVIMQGSGFTLSSISELSVQINKVDPINGSSYIPLPDFLKAKKAIVNVKNNDQFCFKWSVLSALYPVIKNADRINKYKKHMNALNLAGVEFPVSLNQIKKFEKNNPTISINVYYFDKSLKKVLPLRLTSNVCEKHIHLLLLTKNEQRHYCWIKNLGRLITSQITKNKNKHFYCDRCLNHFRNIHKLTVHKKDCSNQNECRIELPNSGNNKIFFKNIRNQLISPFIIYADIETLLIKPSAAFCNSENTKAYQEHEPYSVGFYLKCSFNDKKSFYKSFRGPNCIDLFAEQLLSIANDAALTFSVKEPMKLTVDEENAFQIAEKCHICGKKYDKDDIKVRDHSHLTGKFRGSAHQGCNIKYQEIRTIPVVFHNLSHYDAHFLMRKISSKPDGPISIIPINSENYISFTKTVDKSSEKYKERIKFKFIDSFRFMASSLDYLSSLLPAEKKLILQSENINLDTEQMKMLERKGVLCYDYLDTWDKLNETSLPPKEMFYSKLNNEAISDEDYEFALQIWSRFHIKTLGDYCDLYLKTDVLLLADVFENFRLTCHTIYKLDPSNYYTSPGLSFDAMLKYTDVVIELLTDIDMLLFVEKGIRGGISQCSKRFVEANNKYMNDYNQQEESKYIMYLDCNNLYGYSMMQYLPLNNFKWSHETFNIEKILNLSDESTIGYIFEVDLEYPKELHKLHNDYPFCAENKNVPGKKNVKKLLLTLHNKFNYVIHYRMLKIVLQHGLILKRIHRILQFNQSAWLKPYIDLNTEMRTKATNDFEKNFYKLLSNAIYGKTMENLRSRVDFQLEFKMAWSIWGCRINFET